MKKITAYLLLPLLFAACQSDAGKVEMQTSIKAIQKELGATYKPSPEKLIELQNALTRYADAFPEDTLSVTYLAKAGETAKALQQFDKVLELNEKILKTYPDSRHAASAMFMKAFTLDNDLKRYDEAKLAYEAFLQKYPNDDFADDAKFLLDNLGKSPEEIIKGFEQKQQ